jgi:hypothetical protein
MDEVAISVLGNDGRGLVGPYLDAETEKELSKPRMCVNAERHVES